MRDLRENPAIRYLDATESVVRNVSREAVSQALDALYDAYRRDATIYIIGNGGSASTASHMMNDLNKMTRIEGQPRIRAIALTDNMPLITAIANDEDYADVFVEPLRNLLRPGDVLVAISGSGNSPNVVRAAGYASSIGATVVALCGNPESLLHRGAHVAVLVPSDSICHQEDVHLIVNHALALGLKTRIAADAERAKAGVAG